MARKLVKQLASVLKGLEADVESLTLNPVKLITFPRIPWQLEHDN